MCRDATSRRPRRGWSRSCPVSVTRPLTPSVSKDPLPLPSLNARQRHRHPDDGSTATAAVATRISSTATRPLTPSVSKDPLSMPSPNTPARLQRGHWHRRCRHGLCCHCQRCRRPDNRYSATTIAERTSSTATRPLAPSMTIWPSLPPLLSPPPSADSSARHPLTPSRSADAPPAPPPP